MKAYQLKSGLPLNPRINLAAMFFFMLAVYSYEHSACCFSVLGVAQANLQNYASATIPPTDSKQITITFDTVDDYLANPGIGWQEDRDFEHPLLPETVSYRRRQYSWAQLNPSEGVIDWSAVDNDLQEAITAGKQFSFRIYTMRGEVFGGHQIPQWVIDQGAALVESGEPYYSNCVYQEKWAQFVESMRQKYDGNPNIAWIDISGYGNFNEWSWRDQTNTDDTSLDPQARQRLADMFIGGTASIQCATNLDIIQTVSYTYPGFQQTQLLMPYAGIQQTTRYVANRRSDVGFRHDCLGSLEHTNSMLERVGDVIDTIWRNAPIVYEFCSNPDLAAAHAVLQSTHASLVHDNIGDFTTSDLSDLLRPVGYRYTLKQASYDTEVAAGATIRLSTIWVNDGYAPSYPRMGQRFHLHFQLVNNTGTTVQDWQAATDIAYWRPAVTPGSTPPNYLINHNLLFSPTLPQGMYQLKAMIIDTRTDKPIYLANSGRDSQGRYAIGSITVRGSTRTCCNSYLPLVLRSAFLPERYLIDNILFLLMLFYKFSSGTLHMPA